MGVPNRNGRTYPGPLWEREVLRYNNEVIGNPLVYDTLMECEHPIDRAEVDNMKAVGKVIELYIKDNYVMGKAKILNDNSEATNKLKALIDEGYNLCVSSRGVGSVNASGVVNEDFKLITYDIVQQPSDRAAVTKGVYESDETQELEFEVEEDTGKLVKVCGKDSCVMASHKETSEAMVIKFSELMNSFINGSDTEGTEDTEEDKIDESAMIGSEVYIIMGDDKKDCKIIDYDQDSALFALRCEHSGLKIIDVSLEDINFK
jgi:hypothetical protein